MSQSKFYPTGRLSKLYDLKTHLTMRTREVQFDLISFTQPFVDFLKLINRRLGEICSIKHERKCVNAKKKIFSHKYFVQIMHLYKALVKNICLAKQGKVGFIYTFWCSLSSTSSILDQRLQSFHHLQMTSSEGFQHHFTIISKFVCCGCYIKKNVAFTLISFAVLK